MLRSMRTQMSSSLHTLISLTVTSAERSVICDVIVASTLVAEEVPVAMVAVDCDDDVK